MAKNTSDDLNIYSDKFRPFETRWSLAGADTITLPVTTGTYDFTIDWGDGTALEHSSNTSPNNTHAYTTGGIKTITITGLMTHWSFSGGGDRLLITAVLQGGYTGLISLENAFEGCTNLLYVDGGDWTRDVTTMFGCFEDCTNFNSDISSWDTGNVETFASMFVLATAFNQPIGSWDTSKAITMQAMLSNVTSFGQDISTWNTANVTNMSYMIQNSPAFISDISTWDISSILNMQGMLTNSTNWGIQNYTDCLISWDNQEVSDVTFNCSENYYTAQASTARSNLLGKGWSIGDAGGV